MNLAERLDHIRAGAEKRISAEARAVMHAAVTAVKDSGVMASIISMGIIIEPIPGIGSSSLSAGTPRARLGCRINPSG